MYQWSQIKASLACDDIEKYWWQVKFLLPFNNLLTSTQFHLYCVWHCNVLWAVRVKEETELFMIIYHILWAAKHLTNICW